MTREETKTAPAWASARAGAWLKLLAGIAAVLFFMTAAGVLFQKLPGYDKMALFLDKEGIRSTAVYYTDIKEFAEAEFSLRSNLEFFAANSQGDGPKPKVEQPSAFGLK